MTIPEPALGDVPPLTDPMLAELRPPEQFVAATEYLAASVEDDESIIREDTPPEPVEEVVTELTDEERHDLQQLITVGRRIKTVDVMGFSVRVRSLKVSDDLRIGLYCKPYKDTDMAQRAFQVGVCAAGIVDVDGAPLVSSLAPMTKDEEFDKKAGVVSEYYPITLTQIYQAIMALDQEFAALAVKLGKLSG